MRVAAIALMMGAGVFAAAPRAHAESPEATPGGPFPVSPVVETTPFAPGFRLLVEGKFTEAAEAFATIESPLDPTETKTEIAVELRRIATSFAFRGIVIVPKTSDQAAKAQGVVASRGAGLPSATLRDGSVPPYDDACEMIARGDLAGAEQLLRALEMTARDPTELGVTRVLHAVTRAWQDRGLVAIVDQGPHTTSVILPREERGTWYGWQVSTIDAVAIGAMVTVSSITEASTNTIKGVFIPALFLVIAGPSVVHIAHGRARAAVYSLASRSLLPIAGALGGAVVMLPFAYATSGSLSSPYLPLAGAGVGAAIGLIGAMTFDSATLAYMPKEHAAPSSPPPSSSSSSSWSPARGIHPFVMPIGNAGLMTGVGGTL